MALIGEMHYLTIGGNTYSLPSGGGTITSVKTTAGTHSAINVTSGAANFNVPTKTSHLTNDSGFLTSHQTLYESKINWGNTGITGNVTPMGASLSSEHSANRIAYLNPAAIQIEYTTNGGSSWADSGYSDTEKTWLCTGSQSIAVGQSKSGYSQTTALTTNHWTRITLTGQNGTNTYVYTAPRKLLVNMSTAVGVECLVEYKTGASGASWQTFGTYTVSGWSGWNDIPLVLSTFGGGTTQTTNYWYLRFTFKVTSTRTDNYKGMSFVYGLRLFGSNDWGSASSANSKGPFSSTGHLYSYDVEANATFPAKVTANGGFSGNVTGTATGNLTSVQYDSTNAKLTYTKNGSNTDIVTVATLKSALGSMPASDVYSWAKASTKPSYTASEVGAAASSHAHGNITSGGDITATAPTIASGDQIIINDNSASKVTNGPTFDGSTTTTALTPKGTWETFSKFSGSYNDLTNKPTIPTVPTNVSAFTNDAGYITSADVPEGASAYTGTISAVSTTASNGTSNGFARGDHVHNITGTVVKSALGTGSGTTKFLREDGSWATPAYTTNTDAKLQVAAVTSGTTYYPIVGTGTTAATRQYDTTGFIYKGTNGTTSAVGSAQLTLGNSTASGTANNKQGQLIIYGSTAYAHTIQGAPTAARTLTLPNATGTIALTSDIPSSAANSTAGISISNHSTSNIGSASGWSAGSASTWAFEEVSIPNVTAAGSASTWTFEEKTIPNVTAAGSGSFTSGAFSGGSGSFSATVTSHVLSFSHTHTAATHGADSHTHTAPTIGTAIKVQSKSGGGNGTAPTIGTAIKVQSKKSGSNSTVPSLTVTSTTVVTGTSHTITDNGHTHTLS